MAANSAQTADRQTLNETDKQSIKLYSLAHQGLSPQTCTRNEPHELSVFVTLFHFILFFIACSRLKTSAFSRRSTLNNYYLSHHVVEKITGGIMQSVVYVKCFNPRLTVETYYRQ